jgi:hypothetical protein
MMCPIEWGEREEEKGDYPLLSFKKAENGIRGFGKGTAKRASFFLSSIVRQGLLLGAHLQLAAVAKWC